MKCTLFFSFFFYLVNTNLQSTVNGLQWPPPPHNLLPTHIPPISLFKDEKCINIGTFLWFNLISWQMIALVG